MFQKIPYAAPPIGDLRFQPPVPPNKWEGTLNATYLDAICYQISTDLPEETEDCLYVNVYTPELPSEDNNVAIPVLLYIYGGGFYEGHAMQYRRGPEYLIDHDVVIVTFNYRLGPLGFLSTEDTVVPGNNGLKDQQLAIKWVHENIQLFGGDPEKITIVGESAGGASVSHHLLNKNSEGLFRAAIMESGTAINPWSLQRNAKQNAFSFGAVLNSTFSSVNDSQLLLEYLLTVSAKDLDDASVLVSGWAPVIEIEHDEAFVTEKMYGLIRSGNFVKVPILMGINSEESLSGAGDLDALETLSEYYDNNLQALVPDDIIMLMSDQDQISFGSSVKSIYCGSGNFVDDLAAEVRIGPNSDKESEDCLYLNVYTPQLPSKTSNASLPVMVYFHGGGFIIGDSTHQSYGPEFLVSKDVVVVTLNYRLGVFGFLSTQDSVAVGNNGLKDQLYALQWVYQNINLFGGDRDKITIFGQSAGAASVGYHLISKKSRGLYRAAIMESSTAISPFGYQRNARYYGFKLGSYVNSTITEANSSEELLEVLLKASASDIDDAAEKIAQEVST
ncbi:hypothetical protein GEV33_003750 [Tenebrio molitor]|uniref:Carboxylic ester hydrolase n=1 Tax=Tenebrio molitor TaxID=7067 RepID=A0A8J6HS95_TENMO|nr:hypothetical protein GEV33_003750 [Tenebrio molitor]